MNTTEFLNKAKPYIMRWFDEISGGSGPFAPSPHDISSTHHTGSLSDAQAPQFLKIDGSRDLIGNLDVSSGVLIDGVDISVFKSAYDVHTHTLDAIGNPLASKTFTMGSAALKFGFTTPAVGLEIEGTGAFTADLVKIHQNTGNPGAVDLVHLEASDPDVTLLRFEAGSARPPFVLGSNLQGQLVSGLNADLLDGIDSAGFVQTSRQVIAGNGLTGGGALSSNVTLNVGAGAGITINADDVALTTPGSLSISSINNSTGNHTHAITASSNPGAATALLKSDSDGALTLQNLGVANRVTSSLIPITTDTYDLGSSSMLWRKGWLSEMDAILFAQNTITLLGGWLIVGKNEGTVSADVGSGDTSVDFGQAMTNGHFVLFRAAGAVEYMQVGSLVSGTRYNVTRNLDGTGANAWPSGSVYLVLGTSGDGRIELNAYDTPRIQILTQGATYNAQTEVMRLGDMNGSYGVTSSYFGLGVGDYAGGNYLKYDTNGGFKLSAGTGSIEIDRNAIRVTNPAIALDFEKDGTKIGSLSSYYYDSAGVTRFGLSLVRGVGGSELLSNTGFETDLTGWTITKGANAVNPGRTNTQARTGSYSVGFLYSYQSAFDAVNSELTSGFITAAPGDTCFFSAWTKTLDAHAGSGLGQIEIEFYTSGDVSLGISAMSFDVATVSTGWHLCSVAAIAPATTAKLKVRIRGDITVTPFGTLEFLVDDVSCKVVTNYTAMILHGDSTYRFAEFTHDLRISGDDRIAGGLYVGSLATDPAAGTITASAWLKAAGDGSSNGLFVGTDTQIYRNAANVMRSPDSFVIDGSLDIGGTALPTKFHAAGTGTGNNGLSLWSGYDFGTDRQIGSITGNVLFLAGNQAVTDGTTPAGGFGMVCAGNQASPIVWFYGGSENAFQVIKLAFAEDLSTAATFFEVTSGGDVQTDGWTSYGATSTVTGWSSTTTKSIYYKRLGKTVFVYFAISGTSNATSVSFTLPFNNNSNIALHGIYRAQDNGAAFAAAYLTMAAGSGTVTLYKDAAGSVWTASGTKVVYGHFVYQTS